MTTDLLADETAADLYEWDFGDGETDSTSGYSVSHAYTEVGDYPISLTVTKSGQSNESVRTVHVYPVLDYSKVVCSGVDQSHEEGMQAIIETIYPSATVTIRIESFLNSIIWAKQNGYGIICRATTGLSDYRIAQFASYAEGFDIIPVHAHGSNSNIELTDPSYIDGIWSVRNSTGSWGAGVEFTIPTVVNESNATSTMAGYVSKFMDTYSPAVAELRTLFRDLASNSGIHFDADGYGTVDWVAVEAALNV